MRRPLLLPMLILLMFLLGSLYTGHAQDSLPPDAPQPQRDGKPLIPAAGDPLYAPLASGPEDLHDRFRDYAILTYGPRAVVSRLVPASIRMANPPSEYPNEWRQGVQAFGRNYGDALAREASANTARFAMAAALHEDFRYRPSESRNPLARTLYALSFTVVDRSDAGHLRLAMSNFTAVAAGGYVGSLYLPAGYNDLTHADQRMTLRFGTYAVNNVLREFAPDLYRLTERLHIPFPRVPVPPWYAHWDRDDD